MLQLSLSWKLRTIRMVSVCDGQIIRMFKSQTAKGIASKIQPAMRRLVYVPLPVPSAGGRPLERPFFRPCVCGLSVGVFAVGDAHDFDGFVSLFAIDVAPGTHAKAEEGWIKSFELLDVADFGLEETIRGLE